MKKNLFALLTLLVVLTTLASCGPAPTPQVIVNTVVVKETVQTTVEVAKEVTKEVSKEVVVTATPAPVEPVKIALWTKEAETDGSLQFVKSMADAYTAMHPEVTFEITNKDVETLREDFLTAGLAGNLPDLLWTVNDHAGPFTDANLILPVDDLVDLSTFVDAALAAVKLNGKTWGVPISNGNHLMLLYNKKLVETPPANTDELIAMGQKLTTGGQYGLVYNQTEPFWLVPWLGGFKGKVFADDGVTPTLDTPEMVATLKFLYDIKYTTPIVPAESDYNGADALFKEGKAAMIVNGDWSLGGYEDPKLGLDFGVARLPMVSATKEWPHPYTSGVYFMLPKGLQGAKLDAVKGFISYVTSANNQALMIARLKRLPALKAALNDPLITNDPILKGSADQMIVGTPMPTVSQMRCNWDAMKPEMQAVLAKSETPEDAAKKMQAAAVDCVAKLK